MLTRFIQVRTQVEGVHRWPAAPPPEDYLANAHRHLFVAVLDIGVGHNDRELEINAVTRWVTELMVSFATPGPIGGPVDFGAQSCEQLATRLVEAVIDRYGHHRQVRATVLEDDLLGGGVEWRPNPGSVP